MINKKKSKIVESEWKEAITWFYSDKEIIKRETQRLEYLWEKAQPMSDDELHTVSQITLLSRCNWVLEPSIMSLLNAIGKGKRTTMRIGHNYSITEDRWKRVWAYYLSLKNWLAALGRYTGIPVLLDFCDPNKTTQSHVLKLLGKKTKLKELFVELFSYSLEFHLMSSGPDDLERFIARKAAVESLNNQIKKQEHNAMILAAIQPNPEKLSDGKLRWFEVCHHKFFRRCDIILSSIGENVWRGTFIDKSPEKEHLKELLQRYSLTLESWISNQDINKDFAKNIYDLIGKHTNKKVFQVSFLSVLLRGELSFYMDKVDKEKIEKIIQDREKTNKIFLTKGSKPYKSFLDLERNTFVNGELKKVHKELIALGISIVINCESCIEWHIHEALKNGANEQQIIEAVEVGIEMGGGPATVSSRFALKVLEYYKVR
ncbi:MAG: carboxymuconolactone decarboxylase family protein [Promethearchaeota archaeon]